MRRSRISTYSDCRIERLVDSTLFSDETSGAQSLDTLLTDAKEAAIETREWHQQADDSVFWAHVTISPLWNDDSHGYAVVSKDMTEKHEYEQMLERQNDRLKQFADILVHDLHTPLQLVDGRNELARETGADEHFEVIEQTTDRMERLIDDLLKVAHQGEVVTDSDPTDIEAVLDTAREGAIGRHTDTAGCNYGMIFGALGAPEFLPDLQPAV